MSYLHKQRASQQGSDLLLIRPSFPGDENWEGWLYHVEDYKKGRQVTQKALSRYLDNQMPKAGFVP